MKKIIYIAIIVLITTISTWLVYLYSVILPQKINYFLIDTLSEITGKKVIVGSIKFDIFKGLIIRDLLIYDGNTVIVNSKEAFTRPLVLPLLEKHIIIPTISIKSLEIFVERRADGSINILELLPKQYASKGNFKVFINKISIRDGKIRFRDNTLTPIFAKDIDRLNLDLFLRAPSKIKFNLALEILSKEPVILDATGEYNVTENTLSAKLKLNNFIPNDFTVYYATSGLSLPEGKIDALMTLKYANNILDIEAELATKNLVVSKYNISAITNAGLKISFSYNFTEKIFKYKGYMNIRDMAITGIEALNKISITKSDVEFSNLGFHSDNINAEIFGMPVEIDMKLTDFTNPVLNINAYSELDLETFQNILGENFKVRIPADIEGNGELHLGMEYKPLEHIVTELKGSLDVTEGKITFDKNLSPFEDVNGHFDFTPNQVAWSDMGLRYRGINYLTSGKLSNFDAPGVQIKLGSKDLELKSVFSLKDKIVHLTSLSGKYYNMQFSLSGEADATNLSRIDADLKGVANIDLKDVGKLPYKFKNRIEKMKLMGHVRAEVALKGIVNNIKLCAIDANLFSNDISLFGFKPVDLIIEYSQKGDAGEIKHLHSFLYDGTLKATGKIDLASEGMPYQFDVAIDGMRIEKLKKDTAFKDYDIAGSLKLQGVINGVSDDLSRITGSGRIALRDGKLWQLDLFRGWGVLLFTSDFSNVIFSEGQCNFTIKNKEIVSDNLSLKSDLLNLSGLVKINFDKSISSTLKGEFTQQAIDYGLVKKMGTTMGRYSLIAIKGTLKEPKYFVKLDVANIIDDIASQFLQGQE